MTTSTVPDDATEDLPPGGNGALVPAPDDPQKKHARDMESHRLKFAFWVIGCSGGLAVLLSLVDFFWDPSDGAANLVGVIDMLKLLTTAAIGYAFGQAALGSKD